MRSGAWGAGARSWYMRVLGGRYRLDERVGRGGMAVVWRGYDLLLRRSVAVKTLASAAEPQARERIYAEARAVASINHAHIAALYDLGELPRDARPPVPYLVMEYAGGGSLQQQLAGHDRLDPVLVARVCTQVASALGAAHESGVVHRDVKPANVMFGTGGVKVVDFGIAAALGQPEAEGTGPLMGTPAYAAPEHLDGGEVTAASDVYGLGLLLYECLTGTLPWPTANAYQTIAARRQASSVVVPADEQLPWELVRVCNLCLRAEPGQRPASRDVARLLSIAAARTATARLRGTGTARRPRVAPGHLRPAVAPLVRLPGAAIEESGAAIEESGAAIEEFGVAIEESGAETAALVGYELAGVGAGRAGVAGPAAAPRLRTGLLAGSHRWLWGQHRSARRPWGWQRLREWQRLGGWQRFWGWQRPWGLQRPWADRRVAWAAVGVAVLGAVTAGLASQLPGRLLSHRERPQVVLPLPTGSTGCGPSCAVAVPPPGVPPAASPTSPGREPQAADGEVPLAHGVAAATPAPRATSPGRPSSASPSPSPIPSTHAPSAAATPTAGPSDTSPAAAPTTPPSAASPSPAPAA